VIIAASLVVIAVLAGSLWLAQRPRLVRSRVRDQFVVTLKSGAGFQGVLYAADRQAWVLRGVTAIGAGDRDSNVPVDGEVLVMVADIDYAQRP
jgi:hypothetical protein